MDKVKAKILLLEEMIGDLHKKKRLNRDEYLSLYLQVRDLQEEVNQIADSIALKN